MFELDLSLLFLAALALCIPLGLTYQGTWVQVGGMQQTAIAMHTYLALSTMDLFINPVAINPQTTAAALTVASFTGYVQQVYTTTPAPVNDLSLGGFSIYLPSNVFVSTALQTTPQTVYGCMLKDAAGNLIAAAAFTTPILIQNNGDAVPLQVTLNFTSGGLQCYAEILN